MLENVAQNADSSQFHLPPVYRIIMVRRPL